MAATTALVIGGLGIGMSMLSAGMQGNASIIAGNYEQMVNERNAEIAKEKAADDAKRFRLAMRQDQASNIAAVGASGIRLEGSPLEVLRSNAKKAREDAIAIRLGQLDVEQAYRREARFARYSGRSGASAAGISGAAAVLSGTSDLLGKVK